MKRKKPIDVLQEFVSVFAGKGLLEQTVRVKYRDKKYRLFCSSSEFFAYRINDNYGVSPGFPGWTVCHVTHDEIVEDSHMSGSKSGEPSAREWLRCLAKKDFEVI